MVILYSTNCPKCKVLEAKLRQKNIPFEYVNDIELMAEKGFLTLPKLEVNGEVLDFAEANKWINSQEAQ